MKNLNDLDNELLKSDKMDTGAVRDILTELDSEDVPKPDYNGIRNKLFTENEKPAHERQYSRRAVLAFAVLAVLTLSACTALAVHYIPVLYQWIHEGNESKIATDRSAQYEMIEEALDSIEIAPKIPAYFEANYNLESVGYVDFAIFKILYMQHERGGERITFSAVYDFEDISDVMLLPQNMSESANLEINGIPVVYWKVDGDKNRTTAIWEIAGIYYMLTGNTTESEIADIINSIG